MKRYSGDDSVLVQVRVSHEANLKGEHRLSSETPLQHAYRIGDEVAGAVHQVETTLAGLVRQDEGRAFRVMGGVVVRLYPTGSLDEVLDVLLPGRSK